MRLVGALDEASIETARDRGDHLFVINTLANVEAHMTIITQDEDDDPEEAAAEMASWVAEYYTTYTTNIGTVIVLGHNTDKGFHPVGHISTSPSGEAEQFIAVAYVGGKIKTHPWMQFDDMDEALDWIAMLAQLAGKVGR